MKPVDDFADLVGAGPDPAPAAPTPEPVAAREPQPTPAPAANVSAALPPDASPADVSVFDAHERRQANWEEDAKQIFFGKTEEEKRRDQLLEDLSAMDARNNAERMELARQAEKARAGEQAAAIRQRVTGMKAEIKDLETEAKRLETLAKG